MRRDAIVDVGGSEDRFTGAYEDQVLIAKIFLSFPVMTTADCLDRYRQHPRWFSATTEAAAATYARPDASTRLFLEWLDGYLDARAISDRELRAALERYLRPFRDPLGHALFGKPRQYVRGALKPVLALALPAGYRQRLYARHRRWVVRRSL